MKMKTIWSYLIILMFTTSLMAQNILSTSEFEIIKKNAHIVTDTNDEDGVAKAIEKYVL